MTLGTAYAGGVDVSFPPVDYSLTEVDTGRKWTDGKAIFQKVIDLGFLPNATTKSVAHNITGMDQLIRLYGMGKVSPNFVPIPFVSVTDGSADQIKVFVSTTNVELNTGSTNRSDHVSFMVLEYTKT